MRANKDNSKAFIECRFMHTYYSHKSTLYEPESLCMHFFSVMLCNVNARVLLSTQDSVEIESISGSSKSQQTSN